MRFCISNGYVIDPSVGSAEVRDIWVENGKISDNARKNGMRSDASEEITYIDATGKWVVPGLIDLHVHFREPGFEHKETIASGSAAAVRGGFTTVCCMPNTKPAIDSRKLIRLVREKAAACGGARVLPIGAITREQKGKMLANIKGMAREGACAVSEDGKTVMDEKLMKEAMAIAAEIDLPVFAHAEDMRLAAGGAMNLGRMSALLGIQGIPAEAEEKIVARDIQLAEETGARLHLCHISTRGSVELIRRAKAIGIHVTAETAPHYFTLDEEALADLDTNKKMNPPLRTREDRLAIRQALKDGVIDAIATDHAPHHEREKAMDFQEAPFGVSGLETSFAVSYTELVRNGDMTPMELIDRMSAAPARILGIDRGTLAAGAPADITIIDVDKSYVVSPGALISKGRNTPFAGMTVWGRPVMVMIDGAMKGAFNDR